jgi:hypothetical protein
LNKYLEKIAGMAFPNLASRGVGARLGKVAKPSKVVSPGSKLVRGDKTLLSAALHKAAQEQESNWKHDAIDTGIIGGIGAGTGFGVQKLSPKIIGEGAGHMHNAKLLALTGATSLAADFAGVKLNKAINKHVEKQVS